MAAPAPIRELPAAVAAQIAAGEVVERPAAAFKELLENALDAGATRIIAEAEGAGLERLAVHDDGAGIPAGQLELAFRRHATSKLARAEQLWTLDSYGFRGEALPAIAAAAGRLEASTQTDGEAVGARIVFERGRLTELERCARAAGTSVELEQLFAAQPARRAFLPGPRSERAALARTAGDAALARPDVGLRLELDGRAALRHEPAGGGPEAALREAWAAVFGAESAERAIWWTEADESGLAVEGLAGAPRDARRGRSGMRLFINARPVRDRSLAWALQEAYRGWLPAGRFPLAAVRLSIPTAAVDVNVHPTKAEVQLREPARAFSLVQRSLRAALTVQPASSTLRLRRPDADLEWAPRSGAAGAVSDDAGAVQGRIDESGSTPRRAVPAADGAAAGGQAATDSAAGGQAAPARRGLPPLRMVGQLHRTFIIAEGEQGLVLVDQHAAHERVVYERLLAAKGAGQQARQPLLDPPVLELAAAEWAVWHESGQELAALGFELDEWGEGALRLRAVPACSGPDGLTTADAERWLRDVLSELGGPERSEQPFDRVAASVACHGSVRRGLVLDAPAMTALLRDLERCADPHSCPHGRPTLVEIAATDLLREFGRS